MNKSELKARVAELLDSGAARSRVFAQLSEQGCDERLLAALIAGHVTPAVRAQHLGKVRALIGLTLLQAVLVLLISLTLGSRYSTPAQWLLAAAFTAFPLIFAWGFYRYFAGAYSAFMVLTIVQLPRQVEGWLANPQGGAISLAFTIALFAYVWHVRRLLFPDFDLFGIRKLNGKFSFSD